MSELSIMLSPEDLDEGSSLRPVKNDRRKDYAGRVFGRLTVLSREADRIMPSGIKDRQWLCACECGNKKVVTVVGLLSGGNRSCGCLKLERTREANATHGMSRDSTGKKTRQYGVYTQMKARCFLKENPRYSRYGGRGIVVCDRWLGEDGFANFIADMGPKPSATHSIDRIDNDGNYCPENCRWATMEEQANNKSMNHFLEHNGERMTIRQWSRKTGIGVGCINDRLRRGWTVSDTLSKPKMKNQNG